MHTHGCTYAYTYIYTQSCAHTYIYTHIHVHTNTHTCTYTRTHAHIPIESNAHVYLQREKDQCGQWAKPTCFEKFCNTKFPWCHSSAKKFPSSLNYFPWATVCQLRGALYSWDSQAALLYIPSKPCNWLWILGKECLMVYSCLSISSSAPIWFV